MLRNAGRSSGGGSAGAPALAPELEGVLLEALLSGEHEDLDAQQVGLLASIATADRPDTVFEATADYFSSLGASPGGARPPPGPAAAPPALTPAQRLLLALQLCTALSAPVKAATSASTSPSASASLSLSASGSESLLAAGSVEAPARRAACTCSCATQPARKRSLESLLADFGDDDDEQLLLEQQAALPPRPPSGLRSAASMTLACQIRQPRRPPLKRVASQLDLGARERLQQQWGQAQALGGRQPVGHAEDSLAAMLGALRAQHAAAQQALYSGRADMPYGY